MSGLVAPIAVNTDEIQDWIEVTNTQRTVYPYSAARPADPFWRTSPSWPTLEEWPTAQPAEWEAFVMLPESGSLQAGELAPILASFAEASGLATREAAPAGILQDILVGVVVGAMLWLLLH